MRLMPRPADDRAPLGAEDGEAEAAEVPAGRRRPHVNVTLAIALLALVVGAVGLAKALSLDTTSTPATTRGAARLMQEDFLARFCIVDEAIKQNAFPAHAGVLANRLPRDERLAIASAMDAAGWARVAQGELSIGPAQQLFARRAGHSDRHDRAALAGFHDSFSGAFSALADGSAGGALAGQKPERLCAATGA